LGAKIPAENRETMSSLGVASGNPNKNVQNSSRPWIFEGFWGAVDRPCPMGNFGKPEDHPIFAW